MEDTVPPVAVQVTAVLLVPVTVAVNCLVAPLASVADLGESVTENTGAVVVRSELSRLPIHPRGLAASDAKLSESIGSFAISDWTDVATRVIWRIACAE